MEWKLSLLKAVTFVSFLTSCFHLCLSAYSVLQGVLCKYSRWGVGGEQALHLWTAESERDVRRRHSRLFKKERKKNKQKNVNLQQKPPQRAASLSDMWPCKHSITRFLFHGFCNNHKEIKGVLYIHFLTAASRKSRLLIFLACMNLRHASTQCCVESPELLRLLKCTFNIMRSLDSEEALVRKRYTLCV